jgi:hypothetical protein
MYFGNENRLLAPAVTLSASLYHAHIQQTERDMKRTLTNLLKHCAAQGYTFVCYYDDADEPDYKGTSQREAKEALEACDVMNLIILTPEGKRWGWVFIVNEPGQDPEEQMADYTVNDPVNTWMEGETA